MNRITFVCKWIETHMFAFTDARADNRVSDNLRAALSFGNTISTRFWLSLHSIMVGLQLLLGEPSMFSYAGYRVFFDSVPVSWWAGAMLLSGILMLWRAASPAGHPAWGAVSNTLSTVLWGTVVMSRVVVMGSIGVLGSATVLWLMSAWCLMRTGATRRDLETA